MKPEDSSKRRMRRRDFLVRACTVAAAGGMAGTLHARTDTCPTSRPATKKLPVLLDTDIGGDIDDALALTYLLAQPRCELLGVTTVDSECAVRASLVDAVCRAAGRTDVPIFPGVWKPLMERRDFGVPQRTVLERYPHRTFKRGNLALEFMRQTIRDRPGEITLLTVGPLTNAGLLYAADPEIPSLLRQHVMMGGLYVSRPKGYGLREWNTMADAYASAIVFENAPRRMRCIGLDVTSQCVMSREACMERFAGGAMNIVAEMAEVWFEKRPVIKMHDPLAAMCVFEPSLCTWRSGRVAIELAGDELRGLTRFDADSQGPHQVAVEVRPAEVFDHYRQVVEPLLNGNKAT